MSDHTYGEAINRLWDLPDDERHQFAVWVVRLLDAGVAAQRPWMEVASDTDALTLPHALASLSREEQDLFAKWFVQVVETVKIQERPWITAATHLPQHQMLGMWHNVDQHTRNMTRLNVAYDELSGWTVQGWGRCGGGECEWERVPLSLLGASIANLACHHGYASWESGYKRTRLTIELDGSALVARLYYFFTDGSQRRDYAGTVYLQREPSR